VEAGSLDAAAAPSGVEKFEEKVSSLLLDDRVGNDGGRSVLIARGIEGLARISPNESDREHRASLLVIERRPLPKHTDLGRFPVLAGRAASALRD
jgi:hypothetical protein